MSTYLPCIEGLRLNPLQHVTMIKLFKFLKKIAIALTHNPEEMQGIKDAQSKNLKKWALSSLEWDLVDILDKVLEKNFY